MKKIAKSIIVRRLGNQVKRLAKNNPNLKVVAVVGSMGKTSTKLAAAQYLGQHFRVQTQDGNYNDIVTVPLVFFGHANPPNLTNPFSWLKILAANKKMITNDYPYDVVIVELGTDAPGQIEQFKKYLSPDIALITAVAPEHMEFFAGLDAVATEELSVAAFSKATLLNADLCAPYGSKLSDAKTYGLATGDFCFSDLAFSGQSYTFKIQKASETLVGTTYKTVSETQLYGVLAAVALGEQLGFPRDKIATAIQTIAPAPGRMRVLKGIRGSTILDDTYNASPDAVKAALKTLYQFEAPQRIALLGNMNELGSFSQSAHTEIGELCDPAKLDLVVTLGADANKFAAPAAAQKGCQVKTATSPYEAAQIIQENLKDGAVILAKGSQNRVFAEEAVKQLLADASDASQLVRQSPQWLDQKAQQFKQP